MTIEIADGRGALWQWDTGRKVKITDGDGVKQIHYQNKCFGRSIDVDVGTDGTAIIPDELLQDWHTLTAYAYVTDDTGAYTMVQQDFAVHKRAKPSDYVYTPTEHAGFDRLRAEIGDLSALQTDAKDTLVAAINEVAASGGADWNQNDPNAKDYVKNRPGGYDVVTPEKIISEWEMLGSNYVSIKLSEPLVGGRSYRLTFSENADYSNPVFDSEVVASIADSNDSTQKGSIYVTVKGYASVVQPVTYPEDSVIYSCNNDCRVGYCRLIALAHTETVKIQDKYTSRAFFEIKASSNGAADEDGVFKVTADKSAEDVRDALKRGEVPYVNFEDAIFLWPTDYGHGDTTFISFMPTTVTGVGMIAVLINGENSIGTNREFGSFDLYILRAEQGNYGYWYIGGKLINEWYTKIKKNPSGYPILCLYKGTYNIKYEYEGPLFLDSITDTEIVYKRTLEDGNWVGFKLSAVDGSPSKNGFIKGVSKELILSSSTADSTKKFKLTIDDTGTLSAVEVTE